MELAAHSGERKTDMHSHANETFPKATLAQINQSYLKEVKPLLEKKCFDCHASGQELPWYGSLPGLSSLLKRDQRKAKEHLDFSQDFPFVGHGDTRADLNALIRSNQKSSMPPQRYLTMHWGAKLTDQDKETINDWAQKSLDALNEK